MRETEFTTDRVMPEVDLVMEVVQKLLAISWSWEREAIDNILAQLDAAPLREDNREPHPAQRDFVDNTGMPIQAIYECEFRGPGVAFQIAAADVEDLEEEAFDEMIAQFDALFEESVAAVTEVLGEPEYVGSPRGNMLVSGQFADLIACWPRQDGCLTIQEGQQDTELPVRLTVVMIALKDALKE